MAVTNPPISAPGDDLRHLARGGATNLIGAASAAVATFGFFVLAARLLTPAEVGALAVAIGVFTIATTLSQLGANTGLTRGVAQALARGDAGDVPALLRIGLIPSMAASVLVAIAVWAAADTIAGTMDPGAGRHTVLAVRAIAPWVPLGTATLLLAATSQGFGTMTPAVVVDRVGRSWTQLATLTAVGGAGAVAAATAYTWPSLVATIALALWVRALVRERLASPAPRPPVTDGLRNAFWRFSAPRGVASACQTSILWVDTLLLAALASPVAAGTYALATRFLVVGHLVIGAVIQALGPRLAALFATGGRARAQHAYRAATWAIVASVWPVYLTVAIFAPTLLAIFGPEYVVADRTLVILAAALLIAAACGPVDTVLLMGGRSSWSLLSWSSALVVMVVLDLVLIPRYGIEGAAVAWAVAILVRNLGPLVLVRRLLGLDPFGRGFVRITVSALTIVGLGGLGLRTWLGQGWMSLGVSVVVTGSVYLAALYRQRRVLLSVHGTPTSAEVVS